MNTLSHIGRPLGGGLALVLFVLSSPGALAQDSESPRRFLQDVSLSGLERIVLGESCVQRIADQQGGCLLASSVPTRGLILPYPGINNSFLETAVVAGGENNVASGTYASVLGGYGNTATEDRATIGGGSANRAFGPISTIAGGGSNETTGNRSAIGGGNQNTAAGENSTIAGGQNNSAPGSRATIGGGSNNTAGYYATIGGGDFNTATGYRSTIAGGGNNNASLGFNGAIGGGRYNTASGNSATVAGGRRNTSSGNNSTVPGGEYNAAVGNFSFAAGRRAMANHQGAFVWGDAQDVDKTSSAADEFNVYASGGARIFSNSAATTGVLLAPGGGSWTAVSDRASKENVEPVDSRGVLERVLALEISTWNYKTQADTIRHMGPMAQDFHAAFGLGLGATTIDTIDPDGVALAAIQGLHAELGRRDDEIAALRSKQADLESRLVELTARLESLSPPRE